MESGVLGPLAAWKDGRELVLGPAGQRAVLAALLIRANEVLPTARIVDELWGERPPSRAVKTVQVYVSPTDARSRSRQLHAGSLHTVLPQGRGRAWN